MSTTYYNLKRFTGGGHPDKYLVDETVISKFDHDFLFDKANRQGGVSCMVTQEMPLTPGRFMHCSVARIDR